LTAPASSKIMSNGHFRDSIKLPPQPAAKGIGRDETTSPGGSPSRGPLAVHAPLPLPPLLAVLPRPPSAAAASIGKAAAGGKLDGQWMQDAWQSVKGMERKWQRLRDARGDAVHLALHQANAVISEVSRRTAVALQHIQPGSATRLEALAMAHWWCKLLYLFLLIGVLTCSAHGTGQGSCRDAGFGKCRS